MAEGWDKWEESFHRRKTGLLDDEERGSPVTYTCPAQTQWGPLGVMGQEGFPQPESAQ